MRSVCLSLAAAMLITSVAYAKAPETSGQNPSPQTINAEATCPVCGMYPARYPKWQIQLIFNDNQMRAFASGKDLFTYYLNIADYENEYTQDDIAVIYVKDFNQGTWIDAKEAYFVVGSEKSGPMGKEIIPFGTDKDAEHFIKMHGGKMSRFSYINMKTIHDLNMDSMKKMHHMNHEVDKDQRNHHGKE